MNKVQKIREEVERIQLYTQSEVLKQVLDYIDQVQKEPVSEDLMDATNNYCVNVRKGYPRVMDETDRYICNAFKTGAQWQLKQMMAKAIDATCFGFQGAALFSFRLPASNYLVGSKVKVIVVKED